MVSPAAAAASVAAAAAGGVEDDMLQRAAGLLREAPKIDAAVKNYLAVRIAKHQTTHLQNKVHVLGEDGLEVLEELEQLDPMTSQRLCAAVLKAVNEHELLPPHEWAASKPQGEEQSGLDRIQELSEYKVVHMVWSKARAAETKPAKALGRSALALVWPDVRPKIKERTGGLASDKLVEMFLDAFFDTSSVPPSADIGSKADGVDAAKSLGDSDLVWSANFQAALQQRSAARLRAVQERVAAADAAANDAASASEGGDDSDVEEQGTGASASQGDGAASSLQDFTKAIRSSLSG